MSRRQQEAVAALVGPAQQSWAGQGDPAAEAEDWGWAGRWREGPVVSMEGPAGVAHAGLVALVGAAVAPVPCSVVQVAAALVAGVFCWAGPVSRPVAGVEPGDSWFASPNYSCWASTCLLGCARCPGLPNRLCLLLSHALILARRHRPPPAQSGCRPCRTRSS